MYQADAPSSDAPSSDAPSSDSVNFAVDFAAAPSPGDDTKHKVGSDDGTDDDGNKKVWGMNNAECVCKKKDGNASV